MKVTIQLSDIDTKNIKSYLKEVYEIPRPTRKDIAQYINGVLQADLQSPHSAVSDHIKKYQP